MNKFYTFTFLFFIFFGYSQNRKTVDFSELDKSGMKTDLLLTDAKPFSVLTENNLTHYSMFNFNESYQELSKSDVLNRFSSIEKIKENMFVEATNQTISVGLIHTEFEIVSKQAHQNGLVSLENNKIKRLSNQNIFEKHSTTIITPLSLRKKGMQTTFKLDNQFFINTTSNPITSIKADFDNSEGLQPIEVNQEVSIRYNSEGKKNLRFEIELQNGAIIQRTSSLIVSYSNKDLQEIFGIQAQTITSEYTPDLAIYGENDLAPGVCEYEIFLSPDGILDKPIFVVDGFDPTDTRNILSIYNSLSYTDSDGVEQNLADRIREEENFDVVIINFPVYTNSNGNTIDGGADYIERNALSFATVLNTINAQKVGNEQNVIIGPSMGGLISRYALRYMETNNIEHQTRLWLSFDSPHNGANVPISLQHIFNYFAYGYGDVDAVKLLIETMLRSPAAKQMLVDHFDAHTTDISGIDDPIVPSSGMPLIPTGAPNYRDNFQNRMNTLGFPQNTRNISITNGSGVGATFDDVNGNPINPGFEMINGNINTGTVFGLNTRATTLSKYMPDANVTSVIADVKIQAQFIWWLTQDSFIATAQQNAQSNGIDSSPGGLFDVFSLGNSIGEDPILNNFMNSLQCGYFSFIPTVSAMALNQPDYYHNINLGEGDIPWDNVTNTNSQTPFVNWFMPEENEGHVHLTDANVAFTWCEIVKPDYNFDITTPEQIEICVNEEITTTFIYDNLKGCLNGSSFEVSGNPEGSTINFSPQTIYEAGTITMSGNGFTPGEHSFTVIPDGNQDKAIEITIFVSSENPNLTDLTEYSLDNGTSYTQGNSVTVETGDNINLQIPTDLFNGVVEWFDPSGISRGSNPVITNIQDNSTEEGIWNAVVLFDSDCSEVGLPTSFYFEIIVEPTSSTNNFIFNNLTIYPNPSNGIFYLKGIQTTENIAISIIDLGGRIIKKEIRYTSNNIEIDLSELQNGSYFIHLESGNQKEIKRIIKE